MVKKIWVARIDSKYLIIILMEQSLIFETVFCNTAFDFGMQVWP